MFALIRTATMQLIAAMAVMSFAGAPLAADEHPNVQRAKGIYTAFGKGDAASIVAAVSSDVHWEVVGRQSDCACMGVRTGKSGVEDFLQVVGDMYTFQEFMIQEMNVSGDKVFVLGHYAATNKATKKSYASDWIHVHTYKDGALVSFREFLDTARAAEAARNN
jgi:uncharacterized protein